MSERLRDNVALEASVNVTGAGDLELLEPVRQRQLGDDLFGNLARRFAQLLRQLKRERQCELTHLDVGRLLDDDVRQIEVVLLAQESADVSGEGSLMFEVHVPFRS